MNVVEQTSMGVLVPSASQPFKIISNFKESGDQPSAIQNLVKTKEHVNSGTCPRSHRRNVPDT